MCVYKHFVLLLDEVASQIVLPAVAWVIFIKPTMNPQKSSTIEWARVTVCFSTDLEKGCEHSYAPPVAIGKQKHLEVIHKRLPAVSCFGYCEQLEKNELLQYCYQALLDSPYDILHLPMATKTKS